MIVAKIDVDHINEKTESFYRAGKEFDMVDSYAESIGLPLSRLITRFRCKDDDGNVYYGGWLYNDSQGEVQEEVLRWCMADAGCTTIEIKKNGEWVQEIG